jgi:hypothetical protein
MPDSILEKTVARISHFGKKNPTGIEIDYPKGCDRAANAGPPRTRLAAQWFKIPEQGAVGHHQSRARKWAFHPQTLASYAADSVAVAGLAWPSRVLAVRFELLEALKSLPALQGMREAWRSPRQLRGRSRQKQSNPAYACRSP